MTDKHQCVTEVSNVDGWGYHQCSRKGKYEYEGKYYCKQHHPPEIARKNKERSNKWQAEWDERDATTAETNRLIEQGRKLDTLREQVEQWRDEEQAKLNTIIKTGKVPLGQIYIAEIQKLENSINAYNRVLDLMKNGDGNDTKK